MTPNERSAIIGCLRNGATLIEIIEIFDWITYWEIKRVVEEFKQKENVSS